jgi:hypothetical protein
VGKFRVMHSVVVCVALFFSKPVYFFNLEVK